MGVIEELIRKDEDGTLSFGNYLLDTKTKKSDFQYDGAAYKIKTFKEITKLERNGALVYESVPGSVVTGFKRDPQVVEFGVEAPGDISFTLEMEPSAEYEVLIDDVSAGRIPTNVGGKLNVSLELNDGSKSHVRVVKC
jgi:hypothetical protein